MNRFASILPAAAFTFLVCYFLAFTSGGLHAYFTADDGMNLEAMHSLPLRELVTSAALVVTGSFRPLGGLFYRALFAVADFHPLPFRAFCFAGLILNLALTYFLAKRLTCSVETALLTTLLASYHAGFIELYYSSATITLVQISFRADSSRQGVAG